MSETSTLIYGTGKITREGLAKLPTPPATETHIPIPHAADVETLSHRPELRAKSAARRVGAAGGSS